MSFGKKRGTREIGMSAVRGGTIVGEHEVLYAGPDEVIEFRHTGIFFSTQNLSSPSAAAALEKSITTSASTPHLSMLSKTG